MSLRVVAPCHAFISPSESASVATDKAAIHARRRVVFASVNFARKGDGDLAAVTTLEAGESYRRAWWEPRRIDDQAALAYC
ncbi:uncharacterized protein B0H18DRAFT_1117685 [Fomitopsis serialis]|uniref:uncharacterized protein n=1 Tax=Fomitopsis serialis TaxID=139415 RepID=UPI0020080C69|nr:uncharacterized protein B0H18DRAFT_1117685 [Neoantrodia serialis]KAH9928860.1 hypothetical protein B0H18DRAFT_1117685 [Neoantrodia serialis]